MSESTPSAAQPATRTQPSSMSAPLSNNVYDLNALNAPGLTVEAKLRLAFRMVNTEISPLVSSLFTSHGGQKPMSLLHREKAVSNVLAIQVRQKFFDKIGNQIQETGSACVSIEEIDDLVLAVIAVPICVIEDDAPISSDANNLNAKPSVTGAFVIATPVPANGIRVLMDRMRWVETLIYFATRSTIQDKPATITPDSILKTTATIARAMASGSSEKLAMELVNHFNASLGFDQIALGRVKGPSVQLLAISGVSEIKKNSPGSKQWLEAMMECLDNRSVICCPPVRGVTGTNAELLHNRWCHSLGKTSVGSIPVMVDDRVELIVSWMRSGQKPVKKRDIEFMLESLEGIAPAIGVMTLASRGPIKCCVDTAAEKLSGTWKNPVRLLMVILISALVFWLFFGTSVYQPKLSSKLASSVCYSHASPLDGVLRKVFVQEGQSVSQGDKLLEMDTRSLLLQRDLLLSRQREGRVNQSEAMVQQDANAMAIATAQLDVIKSQLAAVNYQIHSAIVVAEIDGMVAKCDLEKQIGQPFALGDPMLELIATDQWQVQIQVPDSVSAEVAVGQNGTFVPIGRPNESFDIHIDTFSGSAESIDGQNVFIARASVQGNQNWMRSGMEGVTQLKTRQRPNYWIWFHDLWDWTRIQTWH